MLNESAKFLSLPADGVGPLGQDEVHVWLIRAGTDGIDPGLYAEILTPAEKARADKFKFAKDRRLFTTAHAALHSILSQYLGVPAATLEFDLYANGKPKLAGDLARSGIEFNLSHSHEMAMVAVCREREVGIDIELMKPDFAFHDVAARFFSAAEVATLRALPESLQREAFYKCWTSKEAFLKAKGTGLSGTLDEVEITVDKDDAVRISAHVPGWSLIKLPPVNGYAAALVIQGSSLPVNCYRW